MRGEGGTIFGSALIDALRTGRDTTEPFIGLFELSEIVFDTVTERVMSIYGRIQEPMLDFTQLAGRFPNRTQPAREFVPQAASSAGSVAQIRARPGAHHSTQPISTTKPCVWRIQGARKKQLRHSTLWSPLP